MLEQHREFFERETRGGTAILSSSTFYTFYKQFMSNKFKESEIIVSKFVCKKLGCKTKNTANAIIMDNVELRPDQGDPLSRRKWKYDFRRGQAKSFALTAGSLYPAAA